MKSQKITFFAIIFILLLTSLQVGHTQAQEGSGHQIFLPVISYPEPDSSFGMAFFSGGYANTARQANARWVHYNGIFWSEIQPNGPTSNWSSNHAARIDSDVKAMSEAGLEVILTIRSTPAWARDHDYFCGPMREEHFNDFANFVSEVVQRYSQPPYNVTYYEIWNEPDDIMLDQDYYDYDVYTSPYGCWGDPGKKGDPGSDPLGGGELFADLLKTVYPRVKATNASAKVVLGGLLLWGDPDIYKFNRLNFFEGILVGGGGPYFDYANYHAYSSYTPGRSALQTEADEPMWPGKDLPGTEKKDPNTVGQVLGKLDYLRRMMDKYNIPQKPVILSEVALNTWDKTLPDYDPAFEAAKADYVVWLYTRNMSKDIFVTSWYHLERYGWQDVKTGLLDRDDNPLPAYFAFQTMAHTLEGFAYLRDLDLPSGILGFEFFRSGQRIWVLFSYDGTQKSVPVPTGFVEAFDLFETPINPSGGQISFSRPIYIILD